MGSPGEKMYLSSVFKHCDVHARVAIFNPTNYIFLRLAMNALSIELIKSAYF